MGDAWVVERAAFDESKKALELHVRETPKLWDEEHCPHDGSAGVVCHDHVRGLRWRHLNVFNKEAEIVCDLPRGRCPTCGKVWRVTPPWEGRAKHFTKEFEAFALTLMREMPVKKAAEILGEQDTRMWRVVQAYVEEAHAAVDMSDVTCVGVDEMARAKGRRYLTVFADMVKKAVLFATPGKDSETWAEFVKALAAHNGHPHALTHVSMDMSKAYAKGVRDYCRNAQIVYDKFHVIAHANQAVDLVRRAEAQSGPATAREVLVKSRWLWLKNPENLSRKQRARLRQIDQNMLQTGRAYQMRLALQEIYALDSAAVAAKRFGEWCRWVRRGGPEGEPLVASSHGRRGRLDRVAYRRHLGALGARRDQRLHGGTQQRLLRRPPQGPRLSKCPEHDRHALLRCRKTSLTRHAQPLKTARNHLVYNF